MAPMGQVGMKFFQSFMENAAKGAKPAKDDEDA
jgi:hypothetical protein